VRQFRALTFLGASPRHCNRAAAGATLGAADRPMPTEDIMGLKDILVHVDAARGHEARLRLAVELARRNDAHLTGLFVIEPVDIAMLAVPTGPDVAALATLDTIREEHRAARRALADRLAAAFRGATERAGIAAEWRHVEGDVTEMVVLNARYADLAILGQIDPENPGVGAPSPEAVLLGSGRPILMVPYIGAGETVGRCALVAWNASREAARAVNDALPLLEDAETVTVLSVNPARGIAGEGDLPAADIALHLARHGVKAEAAYTVAEDIGVGDVLLSRAADLGSDLLVMGGYGHSRLRELVLGGATRTVFRHMTLPVLLSH
jgi:nucleotide-binding universal stress UspA family protein